MKMRNNKGQFIQTVASRPCENCKKDFQPHSEVIKFCSLKCVAESKTKYPLIAKRSLERMKEAKRLGIKNCVTCNKSLTLKQVSRGTRNCSFVCSSKYAHKNFVISDDQKQRIANMNRKPFSTAKYRGVHKFMRRRIPMPELCANCKVKPPFDLANISGKYKQEINDWVYLCRACHQLLDGRKKYLMSVPVGKFKKGKKFAKMNVTAFSQEILATN